MKSLFAPTDNAEFIKRINALQPGAAAQWGSMQVSQMLAHCNISLETAFGDVKLKRSFIGMLVGGMARKQILGPKPFKRDLPTDKHFVIRQTRNFDEERAKLIGLVRRFVEQGPSAISPDPHPFFGRMTVNEWDHLMLKHLDHHLSQFGA